MLKRHAFAIIAHNRVVYSILFYTVYNREKERGRGETNKRNRVWAERGKFVIVLISPCPRKSRLLTQLPPSQPSLVTRAPSYEKYYNCTSASVTCIYIPYAAVYALRQSGRLSFSFGKNNKAAITAAAGHTFLRYLFTYRGKWEKKTAFHLMTDGGRPRRVEVAKF